MPEDVQSNGLLSQLVGAKMQKQTQDKMNAIQSYKYLLDSDATSDGMRQHAGQQLLSLVGDEFGGGAKGGVKGGSKQGGAGNPLVDFFQHVIGKAVNRPQQQGAQGAQSAQATPAPQPGQPAQMPPPYQQSGILSRDQMAEQQQARAAKAAEAQAATQAKIDAARAVQAAKQKREDNQATYDQAYARLSKTMSPGDAAKAANEFAFGRNLPAEPRATARKAVQVTGPEGEFTAYLGQDQNGVEHLFKLGSDTPLDPAEYQQKSAAGKPQKQYIELADGSKHLAWVTPGQGGATLADTGKDAPEGWKITAPPSGADARTAYAQLLRSLHDEYPQLQPDQIGKMAADEYQRKYGLEIGRAEQQIAINEFQSGIGGGAYKPKVPAAEAPATGTAGAPAAGTPTPYEAPKPKLVPKASGATTPAAAVSASPAASPETNRFVSLYIDSLFGNTPGGGGSGPAKVGIMKGREALAKQTGLDPISFGAWALDHKNEAKLLGDTIQREGAVQRTNEILNQFGDELIARATDVSKNEPNSPLLKKPIRELTVATTGNPELRRFLIALNGFQRQYTSLTSSAGLSRAQLPVGVGEKVDKILDPNTTLQEVIDSVKEVKIEGKNEARGFEDAKKEMLDRLKSGTGAAPAGGAAAASASAPTRTATGPHGEKLGLVDGKWVPLTK